MRAYVSALIAALALCSLARGEEAESTAVLQPEVAQYDYDAIPHDPLASAIFSATLPGTGQVYNKEYLRGGITAVLFYGGLFTAQYMLLRWEQLNTDTFYIAEVTPAGGETNTVHMATAPKRDEDQVGLPNAEKAILVASLVAAAGSYVWGIIDSYNGARRYNTKLLAAVEPKLKLALVDKPQIGLALDIQW